MKPQRAKPFVKWAGGKSRLLSQLEHFLPPNLYSDNYTTYIEPFVGGGAMLFHLLNKRVRMKRVVINDVNADLISCYRFIKDSPELLIEELHRIATLHENMPTENGKKELFYAHRTRYNRREEYSECERAALFLYLNHTCFNGLYRVNNQGEFNVPYGHCTKPSICNEELIRTDSELLRNTEIVILNGDYQQVKHYVDGPNTFLYLDPPYKPLADSSNFKDYSTQPFEDEQQVELKHFCDHLTLLGAKWMLSNSDARDEEGHPFFEALYKEYHCQQVLAHRFINANGKGRSRQAEVLITNYPT